MIKKWNRVKSKQYILGFEEGYNEALKSQRPQWENDLLEGKKTPNEVREIFKLKPIKKGDAITMDSRIMNAFIILNDKNMIIVEGLDLSLKVNEDEFFVCDKENHSNVFCCKRDSVNYAFIENKGAGTIEFLK